MWGVGSRGAPIQLRYIQWGCGQTAEGGSR
jgi:hypothetical protein